MASQIALKNCTFTLKDGNSHELEVKIADGGLNFRLRRNLIYRKNRGRLDRVLLGTAVPVEVSFEATIEGMKSASADSAITPYEFMTQQYGASAYTTVGDACEPYAIDIEVLREPPCNTVEDETITLPEFRVDKIDGGIRDATLKVTGRCNVSLVTAVRS